MFTYLNVGIASAFIALILVVLEKYTRRPPNFPPGPIRLPILGSIPFLKLPIQNGFVEMSLKYGPLFSVYLGNFPVVVLSNLELIREAFKSEMFSNRPELQPFIDRSDGISRGIAFTNGKHWAEQRRFTIRALRDFGFGKVSMETFIYVEVAEMVERLKKDVGQSVGLAGRFNIALLNSLWNIIAGERFSHDDPKIQNMAKLLIEVFEQNGAESAFFFMPWLTTNFPNVSGYTEIINNWRKTIDFAAKKIEQHQQTGNLENPTNFIDVYLAQINRTNDPESSFYKESGIQSLAVGLMDLVAAGSDSASTTITWGILYAMLNPLVQEKIHAEIDSVIGTRTPILSDCPRMAYMEAFIDETFRMSSIAPVGIFHSVAQTGEFGGFTLPKDTIVLPNLWAVHHNAEYWGDPEIFRPERFLADDGEFRKDEAVMPFGNGKRICPGETLARDQLFLFFSSLFQAFVFRVDSNNIPTSEPTQGMITKPGPFHTLIKLRNADP